MEDSKAFSGKYNQFSDQAWVKQLRLLICQRLAQILFLQLIYERIKDSNRTRNGVSDQIFILSNNKEIWEKLLSLLAVKGDVNPNEDLSSLSEILTKINVVNHDTFLGKFIEQYQLEWYRFFSDYLLSYVKRNTGGTNIFDKVRDKIYLFAEKSKMGIEEEIESISQKDIEETINFISNQRREWKIANNLAEKIVRNFDFFTSDKDISNVINILDSRIDKINKLLQSQKIEFKNNFIDLENSYKEKEEELKKQVEANIQTIKENFEGQAGRIGMEKAFRTASSRIRKGRRWAFVGFILGLVLLFSVGCFLLFSNLDSVNEQGHWSVQELVHTAGRYLAVAAIVWWTWFIAKRFSQLVKIEEDYAFKETMVLSYKGYHEEVGDNEELCRELLQLTIKMFAENPTRLLEKRECALPVQELVTIITDSLKASKK